MAATISDIVKEVAQGKSVVMQRVHGGVSNTIVAGLTVPNTFVGSQTAYLCPIPWHARILDISVINDADTTFSTAPQFSLSLRRMESMIPVSAEDVESVEYEIIKNTTGGNVTTLAGAGEIANNAEVVIAKDLKPWGTSKVNAATVTALALPMGTRTHTLAECYAVVDAQTKAIKLLDSAKDAATKDQYGMLTLVSASGAGGGAGGIAISITYVDPAPSGITIGKIIRNGK